VETIRASRRVLSGRYRIDELLGTGGMATVWRGQDLRLDRPVAIKELAAPWLRDRTAVERFDREARMAARLAHPNVVAVYDVGIHHDGRYLVMELVEGATVAQMLVNGPLPVAQAIAIAVQTCDGLAAAHAAGIIHRDVKPANLIVTPGGVVKICDFGIARAPLAMSDPNLTGPMLAMGSSKYMAPEQVYGQADARSDLYALGCTLYTMLAGIAPFAGDVAEVVDKHLTQRPVPLRERRADVAVPLEALVAQLLAKTPAARPVDAGEVKVRLLALDEHLAPLAAHEMIPSSIVGVPEHIQALRAATPPVAGERAGPPSTTGAARSANGGLWRWAGGGVLIALAAILIALAATWRSLSGEAEGLRAQWVPAPGGLLAPSTTRSSQPQAASHPSTSTQSGSSASPGALESSQAPPADPIAAMRLAIQRQVDSGNLNPDKAGDLYKKVDELARAMNDPSADTAAKKVKELRDRLAALLADGQLSAAGYDALILALELIAATLP
jgi:eukaryotic-like serine/threonine-protein kinase